MDYAIYFEADNQVFRLPVNPEELSRSDKADTGQYRILSGKQIPVPAGRGLSEISFDAEFPFGERSYTNTGFQDAAAWIKRMTGWMENKTVVRFIAGNGTDEVNLKVLVTQVKCLEKAGEEGDKYLSISLLEYVEPVVRYVAVQRVKPASVTGAASPAVTAGKTHTVQKGDTLWGIARKYYGNGSQYTRIYQANSGMIRNPGLIYPGQVLTIPG